MNKARRKNIILATKEIESSLGKLKRYLQEEEDGYDNLSEGLQATMRGEEMAECVEVLEENIDKIEDAILEIQNI